MMIALEYHDGVALSVPFSASPLEPLKARLNPQHLLAVMAEDLGMR